MLVIAGVGDVQTDFVQRGGASEILLPQGKLLNCNVLAWQRLSIKVCAVSAVRFA